MKIFFTSFYDQLTVRTHRRYTAPHSWSHPLNLYCLLSPVNTYHAPSPSSSTGRAMCARVWRSPSTSLHTTSQNTTSALRRPPSRQCKVIPQTLLYAYVHKTKQQQCSVSMHCNKVQPEMCYITDEHWQYNMPENIQILYLNKSSII